MKYIFLVFKYCLYFFNYTDIQAKIAIQYFEGLVQNYCKYLILYKKLQ